MNNQKVKSLAMWLVIGVLGLGFLMSLAKAENTFSWENVENRVAELLFGQAQQADGFLGASGTRFPNGLSVDSTSPSAGQIRGTTLTMTGDATLEDITLSGSVTSTGSKFVLNSLDTRISYGSLADATTTLFCVQNPLLTTSTVSARVKITGVTTSSVKLYVAPTSSSAGLAGLGTLGDNQLMEAAAIGTSTLHYFASGVTTGSDGMVSSGGGTFLEVLVSKSNYICGQVVAEASINGVTNADNTFAGTYTLEWKQ